MRKIIILMISLCLISSTVFAGNGTKSALFLRMPTSAVVAGLAGAYTSQTNDINSIYANAAGLGFVENKQFTFMHNNYFQDLNYNYLAYSQPVKTLDGVLGLNVSMFDAGDFRKTLIATGVTYTDIGSFDARDLEVGVSYGKKVNDNFNFGAKLKYISSKIDDSKATAFATDFGVIYDYDKLAKLGFTIKNLGAKLKYQREKESLPIEYRLGVSTDFELNKDIKLLPAIDLVYPDNESLSVNIGAEVNYINSLFIRLGYDSAIDAGSGVSCGLGFKVKALSIDYAFTSYDSLGDGHRISLTLKY